MKFFSIEVQKKVFIAFLKEYTLLEIKPSLDFPWTSRILIWISCILI